MVEPRCQEGVPFGPSDDRGGALRSEPRQSAIAMKAGEKKIVLAVGAGCGVLLLTMFCVAGAAYLAIDQYFGEPERYGLAFLKDLRGGEAEVALRRMDGPYQSSHDLSTFRQSIAMLPALQQHHSVTFDSREIDGEIASLRGRLITPDGERELSMDLTRQEGHWYVTYLTVDERALQ